MTEITYKDFEKVDIRVGTVLDAELIPDAKFSTHKLKIDFGKDIGIKKSCARIVNYDPKKLIGRQVLAVVNFPPRQIGQNMSEVLTLGVEGNDGEVILVSPDSMAPVGSKLF